MKRSRLRKVAVFALCWTISRGAGGRVGGVFGMQGRAASGAWATEIPGGSICFPGPEAVRILRDVEEGMVCKSELSDWKEYGAQVDNALTGCQEEKWIFLERVKEVTKERDDAVKLAEQARKDGIAAAKIAAGPWYSQVWSAGKWIAGGILVGILLGMGASK